MIVYKGIYTLPKEIVLYIFIASLVTLQIYEYYKGKFPIVRRDAWGYLWVDITIHYKLRNIPILSGSLRKHDQMNWRNEFEKQMLLSW